MSSKTLSVDLAAPNGDHRGASVAIHVWERGEAVRKALNWGGLVAGMAVLMLPIPGIHFFSPLVLFGGAPLTAFLIFRLYNGGADMSGHGACPACSEDFPLTGSADRWPVQKICPHCKGSVSIVPVETL